MKKSIITTVTAAFTACLVHFINPEAAAANADLAMTSFSAFNPQPIAPGGHPTNIALRVSNYGPASVGNPTFGTPGHALLDMYLSPNATFGDADDVNIGTFNWTVLLPAGSTTTATISNPNGLTAFAIPGDASGQYYVFLKISHTSTSGLTDPAPADNWALLPTVIMVGSGKAPATVTLGNLSQPYDGTAKSVSITTAPPGLAVDVTYDGSGHAPTNVGNYVVIGTINDPAYEGSSTNTLAIAKAAAAVLLGDLSQTYNGAARSVSITTTPPGLLVNVTYNGLANAPTNAGSYTVVGTVADSNYQGSATATLFIQPAETTLTDAKTLADGSFQFSFTNSPWAVFNVLATPDPTLPPDAWTALGVGTEVAPGRFQFTDPQATNSPQRFYRVRSP